MLQTTLCPICGPVLSSTVFTQGRLYGPRALKALEGVPTHGAMNTVLCSQCGLLYRFPSLEPEYYMKGYYENYKSSREVTDDDLLRARNRNQKFLSHLRKYLDFRAKRIADVGCGRGILLDLIAETQEPSYLLGIEPSSTITEWIKTRRYKFDVVKDDISSFAVKRQTKSHNWSDQFDIVLMLGVIEHITDPFAALIAIKSMLINEGILYLYTNDETPNLLWDPKWQISLAHVLYFTPRTIMLLLAKAGFIIFHLETQGTSMHVFAKSAITDYTPDSSLREDQVLKLYRKYKFSASRYSSAFRNLSKAATRLMYLIKKIAKVSLGFILRAKPANTTH